MRQLGEHCNIPETRYKQLRPKVYKIIRRIDTNYNEKVRLPKIKIEDMIKYFGELWNDPEVQSETDGRKKSIWRSEDVINL